MPQVTLRCDRARSTARGAALAQVPSQSTNVVLLWAGMGARAPHANALPVRDSTDRVITVRAK
ncbi:MAG: hypothetical protein K2Z81_06955 [Cyanobacteria bacterium]|nr:hypothetical protein [Cyanobacteriota bacterium]